MQNRYIESSRNRPCEPGRRAAGIRRAVRIAGLAVGALLVVAAVAAAATHFRPGVTYKGKSPDCSPGGVPGTSCTFKFRASTTGRTLKFIGATVVDTWGCHGGGGEARLGGKASGATPIPLVTLHSDGSLSGSVAYVIRPSAGPAEHHTSKVTGHIAQSGKAAVITFHDLFHSSRSPCTTEPVTISASGSSVGGPH